MTPLRLAQDAAAPADPLRGLPARMAAGDADAHRALYEALGRDVLGYLRGRLNDDGAAEELLHEVMLSAWKGAAAFRGESRVRTWLLAMAHNAACNELRRRSRLTVVPEPERVDAARNGHAGPRHGATLDERIDLDAAIGRLPAAQREVLELVFAQGLGQEEAAAVLGVAVGTVKSRLNRAKERLRRHLSRREDPQGGRHA